LIAKEKKLSRAVSGSENNYFKTKIKVQKLKKEFGLNGLVLKNLKPVQFCPTNSNPLKNIPNTLSDISSLQISPEIFSVVEITQKLWKKN